jgi:predicted MFS family arabinose efflux permease
MRMLHEDEKSTANSIRQMAFQSGGVLAPWLGGQLMEASLDLPAYLGAGLYAIFAPLSYVLLRSEKEFVVEPAIPS